MTRRLGSKFFAKFPAVTLAAALLTACFEGAEREKPAPPGNLGGLCLAPDGHCTEGQCNQEKNYCYDAASPCEGFFCGGDERGECVLDQASQPSCVCALGFNNDTYALYCCPDAPGPEPDPNCAPASANSGGAGSDASSSG